MLIRAYDPCIEVIDVYEKGCENDTVYLHTVATAGIHYMLFVVYLRHIRHFRMLTNYRILSTVIYGRIRPN
jgi:hypothetical protein